MKRTALVLCLLSLGQFVRAESLPVGTWVQRTSQAPLTLTIEAVGAARKLTYTGAGQQGALTVLTQLDGKDAPVLLNGKPSGQTMAIRVIDSRHTFAIMKFQGKETSTSKAELSPDGKVIKVENIMTGTNGGGALTYVDYWDKK